MGMTNLKNTQDVKRKIVDAYRRGVCDHNGKTYEDGRRYPQDSHFGPACTETPQQKELYRANYVRIFGHE